jgi:REP element-mobilizing transposase RayT
MNLAYRVPGDLHAIGQPSFVTLRLWGSLPAAVDFPGGRIVSNEAFASMDRLLDEGRTGPLFLREPRVARAVVEAIRHGGDTDFLLHAWVVMPNHVHMLITPQIGLPTLMRKLKDVTARDCNTLLGRAGQRFWHDESYDHFIGDLEEFWRIGAYIVQNPVSAGLADCAGDFEWSSASSPSLATAVR